MKQRPLHTQPRRALATAVAALILATSLGPVTSVYAQTPPKRARASGQSVTLNFVNAEIDGVARAMGAMLKQQFVVDPRVKGTITLYSEEAMSPREAYNQFLAALRGQGFTVVEASGLYKVVPEADAKLQSNTVSQGAVSRQGDQVITQIFKINHENANNLVPVLRPLISPNNTINANPGNNTLVITDYADNLQRIGKIIAAMDTASTGDVEVIAIKHAVAADIAPLVQRLTDSAGGNSGGLVGIQAGAVPGLPGTPGGAASILVDQRSNSLLVRAPSPARMTTIRSVIEKLDKPMQSAGAAGNVWVVYLKNADAVKLATVLRAAYPQSNNSGGGGGGLPQMAQPVQQNNLGNAANSQSAQATAPVTPSAGPSTGGFIQADPATNSLIITAAEPLYRQLRAAIDQLDSRRAQVYVESLIVEVDADKSAELGIQWQGITGSGSGNNVVAGGSNFGSGSGNILSATAGIAKGLGDTAALADAVKSVPTGFNIGLAHKFGKYYTLGAMANALNTVGGVNILSTPNLVTLDNEEAKIVVGENIPLPGGLQAVGNNANPFQSIERKDVGITLRLKPQIGENGSVRMTIFQESSSVIGATKNNTIGASTAKRSIDSTIVVDDGQIIVLGGLITDEYSTNSSKVPLLGDIPYLGALFRSESRVRTKKNLMVFLRPVVMRDQNSSSKLSIDRYDYIRNEQQSAQPDYNGIMRVNDAPVLPALKKPNPEEGIPIPKPLGLQPSESPASGVTEFKPPVNTPAPSAAH
jgi:general secretion pathway protein D